MDYKFGTGNAAQPQVPLYPTLNELDLVNQLPPKCLIDGLLPENAMGLLTGQKGLYKSFMAIDMGLSLSHGLGSFHGHPCTSGAVFYIAGEGAGGLGQRINAWRMYHKTEATKVSPFFLTRAPFAIMEDGDIDRVIHTIKTLERDYTCQFKLLVVDTISRALQGAEEKEMQWGKVITNLERVKEEVGHGMSCLGVAHQGKNASMGTRGSSVADCNSDAILIMSSNKKETPDMCSLYVDKLKDLPDGETYNFVTCKQTWTRDEVGKQNSIVLLSEDEETECQRLVRLADRQERMKNTTAKQHAQQTRAAQQEAEKQQRDHDLRVKVASLPDGEYTAYGLCRALDMKTGENKSVFAKLFPLNDTKSLLVSDTEMRSVRHVATGDADKSVFKVFPTR